MKKAICVFLLLCLSAAAGCGQNANENRNPMPADFSFALTWNVYGVSSYDSAAGRLVKTTDATNPADYETALTLTQEELQSVYALLSGLSLEEYPDEYNPAPGQGSEPSETVILTLRANGEEKTVACRNIALNCAGGDDRGKAFLSVVREIETMLTASPQWQALPDYERLVS